MTPEQTELWLDSPLLRYVRSTYRPADTLELLEGLHLVCTELEDRYPGLPFTQIVSTADAPSPWPTLRALHANPGVSSDDICTLFERYSYIKPPKDHNGYGRFETVTAAWLEAVRDLGYSKKALARAGYGDTACHEMHFAWWMSKDDGTVLDTHHGAKRCRQRLDMQDVWDETVRLVIAEDLDLPSAGVRTGTTAPTVKKVCKAFLFQLWQATEGRLP